MDLLLNILRDPAWNGIAAIIGVLVLARGLIRAAFRSRPGFPFSARVFGWIRANPQLTLQATLTLAALLSGLLITRNYVAPILIAAYALSLALSGKTSELFAGAPTRKFRTISLESIANANLHETYQHPPSSLALGIVPFVLRDIPYDTARSKDSTRALIELPKPIPLVTAVHFLANAGGARSEFRGRPLAR